MKMVRKMKLTKNTVYFKNMENMRNGLMEDQ